MAITRKRLTWVILVVVVLLALDQGTKQLALRVLETEGATFKLPGPVDLTLVFNRSNAFGLVPVAGDVSRWALVALNLSVAALLTVVLFRRPVGAFAAAGMTALIAGAVGNAADRVWLGAVIDFVDASEVGFRWVFNVADVSIDAGLGLLLLAALMPAGAKEQAGPASRAS